MAFAVFTVTALFAAHPEWAQITIGSVVFAVIHYLASKFDL